jgi:sortase B
MAKLLASSGRGIYRVRISDVLRDLFERIIDAVSFSAFVFIALIGIYAIIDAHRVEESAKLDGEVAKIAETITEETDKSFEELKKINSDIVAWLKIDQTSIDYPVVWSDKDDNTKYLTRNFRGEFATAGSIFVDYRNFALNDKYTVIYGHRMSGDKMFSDVTKFMDADYFKTHRTGTLVTEKVTYNLEVILSARPNVSRAQIYNVTSNRNASYSHIYDLLVDDIAQKNDIKVDDDEKLILLSTCDKDASHFRNIILLRATPQE